MTKDIRHKLMNDIFFSKCLKTTIVDYTLRDEKMGILFRGKSKTCGEDVARNVEDA